MINTFVLLVSFMTPYGWTQSSHIVQFDTIEACQAAGLEHKAKLPGSWEYEGHQLPLLDWECQRGRVNHDIGAGWSNW